MVVAAGKEVHLRLETVNAADAMEYVWLQLVVHWVGVSAEPIGTTVSVAWNVVGLDVYSVLGEQLPSCFYFAIDAMVLRSFPPCPYCWG